MGCIISCIYRCLFPEHETREIKIIVTGILCALSCSFKDILSCIRIGERNLGDEIIYCKASMDIHTVRYKYLTIHEFNVGTSEGSDYVYRRAKPFLNDCQGFIFVFCSHEWCDLHTAVRELHYLLCKEELRDAAVLLLIYERDDYSCMSVHEIIDKLALDRIHQNYLVQPISAITGEGLKDGLEWLLQAIKDNQ